MPPSVMVTPVPAQPTVPPVVMAPPVTRRQARQARRRQQHRRVGLLGGAAIAVAAIVVVGALAFGVHKVVEHRRRHEADQATVLLQVQGSNQAAAGQRSARP